jgi:hypothetical protein
MTCSNGSLGERDGDRHGGTWLATAGRDAPRDGLDHCRDMPASAARRT